MPLKKFIKVQDEFELESFFSRIWPVDAFYEKGKIIFDALSQYQRETITMLQLFSNVVVQLNDYALENGINQETIDERFDQFNRLKEIMYNEFGKKFSVGTMFRPTKEDNNIWREYAAKELGLSDYLYDLIASNFRFERDYETKRYLQKQQDK